MSVDSHLSEAKNEFSKAQEHLGSEFSKLQIGRASSSLIEDLMIESYGAFQPLKAVAQITIPEARTISIKAWDKSLLKSIETAIGAANLGLNPNNNGESILINIPPLTEERRKDLVKIVFKYVEDAKIVVRQARQKAMQKMKDLEKNEEISETELKTGEKRLQEAVDQANKALEEMAKNKEKEVLTV